MESSTFVAIEVKGEAITLELGESSENGEIHHKFAPMVFADVHAVLFCFSIEWQETLDDILKWWVPHAKEFAPGILGFLVGCKKDLRTDPDTLQYLATLGQMPGVFCSDRGRSPRASSRSH